MKNTIVLLLILVIVFCNGLLSTAQTPVVTPKRNDVAIGDLNVEVDKEGINIDYRIILGDNVKSCNVEIQLLLDGKLSNSFPGRISGDIGRITESGMKHARFNLLGVAKTLADKDIRFKLNVTSKDVLMGKTLIMASANPLTPQSYGLMAGYVRKIGGYARIQSNFQFKGNDYIANSQGEIDSGGMMWTTGKKRYQELMATAGVLVRAHKMLYPYVGLGYGFDVLSYEDTSGEWGKISDKSVNGIAGEAGLIVKAGPMVFSAGVGTIMCKDILLQFGIGLIF